MTDPTLQQAGDSQGGGSRQLAGLAAYRGCWVALIGDQIAGVGLNEDAARLAARHSRPRERVTAVILVPEDIES